MISITRVGSSFGVNLLYYVVKDGTPVPADSAVTHIKLFSIQELALKLGYVVDTMAEGKTFSDACYQGR